MNIESSVKPLRFFIIGITLTAFLTGCGGGSSELNSSSQAGTGEVSSGGGGTETTSNGAINSYYPTLNSIGIPIAASIILTISGTVDAATLNDTNFYLTAAGNSTKISGNYSYSSGTVTFNPTSDLQESSSYTVAVTEGVKGINGQSLTDTGGLTWGFSTATGDAPPHMDVFVSRMINDGNKICNYLKTETDKNNRVLNVYYDSARVFYQIADFTGQSSPWNGCAKVGRNVYVNDLLKSVTNPGPYGISGYWRFGHGLMMDYKRTGDTGSLYAFQQIRNKAAFSSPDVHNDKARWFQHRYSREIAYGLEQNIVAVKNGEVEHPARVAAYVDMALKHIDIWTSQNYIVSDTNWHFVQPFMTGLTASSLIQYYEYTVAQGSPDTRIPPALKAIADWVWNTTWVPNVKNGYGAFIYKWWTVNTPRVGAPDLNLLIAPYYAWVYKNTCNVTYRERADLIFAGGVKLADIKTGKRFDQSYRNAFDYLNWRSVGDSKCK